MPKITVITPSYNHCRFLPARISSILDQTNQDFEWIVIDDGSSDGSQKVWNHFCGADPRVRLLFHDSNKGLSATTDEAIAISGGEYVVRAESDDFCRNDFLQRLSEVLDSNPNVGMVHALTRNLDPAGRAWFGAGAHHFPTVVPGETAFTTIVLGNPVSGPSTMVRRDLLETIGGFGSPLCMVACDWRLALLASKRTDIGFVDEPVGYHRLHAGNLSRDAAAILWESYAIVAEAFEHIPLAWSLPSDLQARATRAVTRGPGTALFMKAVAGRSTDTALSIRRRIEEVDPGGTMGYHWWSGCVRKGLLGGIALPAHDVAARHLRAETVVGAAAAR